jgi:hypothetical protein
MTVISSLCRDGFVNIFVFVRKPTVSGALRTVRNAHALFRRSQASPSKSDERFLVIYLKIVVSYGMYLIKCMEWITIFVIQPNKLMSKCYNLLAFNLKSLNNNASALIEARSQSAGVRSALKNVQD